MGPWNRVLVGLAASIIVATAAADAQTLRGQVLDSVTSEPIHGMELVVLAQSGDTIAVTRSDEEGRFAVSAAPGTYTVRCRCLGHKPKEAVVEFDGENYITIRMAPIIIPN